MLPEEDCKDGEKYGPNCCSDGGTCQVLDYLPSGHDLNEVIQKLRGEILENWQTTGTLAALFARGGFILKVVACS